MFLLFSIFLGCFLCPGTFSPRSLHPFEVISNRLVGLDSALFVWHLWWRMNGICDDLSNGPMLHDFKGTGGGVSFSSPPPFFFLDSQIVMKLHHLLSLTKSHGNFNISLIFILNKSRVAGPHLCAFHVAWQVFFGPKLLQLIPEI